MGTTLPSMVDKYHRAALPSLRERPFLYDDPALGLVLFAAAAKRRNVVQDQNVGVADECIDFGLTSLRCQIREAAFRQVSTQQAELVR